MYQKHVAELLSIYIDGQLTPTETAEVEEHLAHCQQCRQELEQLRRVVAILHSCPQVLPQKPFRIDIPAPAQRKWPLRFMRLASVSIAVSAVLLMAIMFTDYTFSARKVVQPRIMSAPATQMQDNREGKASSGKEEKPTTAAIYAAKAQPTATPDQTTLNTGITALGTGKTAENATPMESDKEMPAPTGYGLVIVTAENEAEDNAVIETAAKPLKHEIDYVQIIEIVLAAIIIASTVVWLLARRFA